MIMMRHMDRTNNDCLNVSVLLIDYAERCRRLVEDPEAVAKELLR
jgi:hypothetical protein